MTQKHRKNSAHNPPADKQIQTTAVQQTPPASRGRGRSCINNQIPPTYNSKQYSCTLNNRIEIVRAGRDEYNQLARFHYRDKLNFPCAAIFAMKETHPIRSRLSNIVGVIVYTMPVPNLSIRDKATAGAFLGLNNNDKLKLINKNVRCISRVIIDPRYRGIGLGARIVRETMPRMNVPFIESMAVMGLINPFCERAGMKSFPAAALARTVQMTEAFGMVGIAEIDLVDPQLVQRRINSLDTEKHAFIDYQIKQFMRPFAKRRNMPNSIERTRFVLSRLTDRPIYYFWKNPDLSSNTSCYTEGIYA